MEDRTYTISKKTIGLIALISVFLSWFYVWNYQGSSLNFMGGDAQDYYSALISVFIKHNIVNPVADQWYLLKTDSGILNVHPIGLAILLLPFFLIALVSAALFGFPVDGYSFPFQMAVAVAALVYLLIGLNFLKKLFRDLNIPDKVTALTILILYFGTNLLHYTLSEAGMSHVYSFALLSAFMFVSNRLANQPENRYLIYAGIVLGLILLLRPNNIFILLTLPLWFSNFSAFKLFIEKILKNKFTYIAAGLCVLILSLQGLVWYLQSGEILQNTYKRDGFYWLHPHVFEMLFGFDGGFFIYTPLCLVFMLGLIPLLKQSHFKFYSALIALCVLFYFFGSYWAYTYFDGFGIRVLVDYYGLFALLGARLLENTINQVPVLYTLLIFSAVLVLLNLVYTYQANRGILLRAGMTYAKWKYVFLKTDSAYQNCLGGSHELKPYSAHQPELNYSSNLELDTPYDFSGNEFGPALQIESLNASANRFHVNLDCSRTEKRLNASREALLCLAVEDTVTHEKRAYTQFQLNETPSRECCEAIQYHYNVNLVGDFKKGDRLSVYVWNREKQDFLLNGMAIKVYNYSYQLN